jgi:UDP-2,3-diacylglucosamine pyrophosphatase LpxH
MARPGLRHAVVARAAAAAEPSPEAEQVTERREGAEIEYRSTSRKIRTVEDLLAHIEADMTRFEIAASEATKWEVATAGDNGQPIVTELHRVFVRLRPRGGPAVAELVEAMILGAGAAGRIGRPKAKAAKRQPGPWQVVVVADTHFAKYAWSRTTGGDDYDIDHAERLVGHAGRTLLDLGDAQRPARRTIAFLGDLFHYDTPDAKTTRGTPLERDGRLERMVETGSRALVSLVERSAETCQTDCVVVPGNHDETMTAWFRLLLRTHFARDRRVSVHEVFTHRQYLEHDGTLLGFAHGDKARTRLPALMSLETGAAWGRCRCREIHTGHLHKQAARIRRVIDSDGIDTVDGVVVRIAPALCPPDDWHSQEGWIGSRQAMETFFYRAGGGFAGMLVADGKSTTCDRA